MHILLPETDNCPSWISGRESMTIENISRAIFTKECCRAWQGLNPWPPGLQSDGTSNWASEAGPISAGRPDDIDTRHLHHTRPSAETPTYISGCVQIQGWKSPLKVSKFKEGPVHSRNLGMKRLKFIKHEMALLFYYSITVNAILIWQKK